ncbi:hypothetical protein ZWY2020_032533 [Hordeum vulgare]|nr:hypothetical protein ZWY2020_032533 [Hordeum vulgare]
MVARRSSLPDRRLLDENNPVRGDSSPATIPAPRILLLTVPTSPRTDPGGGPSRLAAAAYVLPPTPSSRPCTDSRRRCLNRGRRRTLAAARPPLDSSPSDIDIGGGGTETRSRRRRADWYLFLSRR